MLITNLRKLEGRVMIVEVVIDYWKNSKYKTAVVIGLITWGIVGITLIWHVIVIMWNIFPFFFSSNLYIPETVKITSYMMGIVVLWILVVSLLSVAWVKYNRFRFKKKRNLVNAINHSTFIGKALPWSEILISKINSQSILKEVESVKKNISVVKLQSTILKSNVRIRHPEKQLNKAISLIRNGDLTKGISTLRMILELPEAPPIVKKVANVKLSQCLYELGYKDLTVKKTKK